MQIVPCKKLNRWILQYSIAYKCSCIFIRAGKLSVCVSLVVQLQLNCPFAFAFNIDL